MRVAFRLGIHVDGVSQSLESREADGNLHSWAYVVKAVSTEDVQREIDQYNAETVCSAPPFIKASRSYSLHCQSNPELTKVFISASDKNSVSVTGPPSRLKNAFLHSQVLRYSKHLPMPVYNGLCHAPHLYNTEDIKSIVDGSEPKCSRSRQVQLPLYSAQTGKPYPAEDAGSLFEQICTEILTGTIYLDNLTAGILNNVSNSGMPQCQVLLFRTSLIAKGFLLAIESELPHVIVVCHDLIDWSIKAIDFGIPRSPKQSKLAVVGMSCRMPGGANDTELFWKLMAEGRDVHTRVPADRFDLNTHYDPSGNTPNATETPFGNFIDKPGLFDAGFFNMSPREVS